MITVLLLTAAISTEVSTMFAPEALARYGLLGIVLGWFMLRTDKRLAGIEHKLTGLHRTMLIELLTRPNLPIAARSEVRRELRKSAPDVLAEFGGE